MGSREESNLHSKVLPRRGRGRISFGFASGASATVIIVAAVDIIVVLERVNCPTTGHLLCAPNYDSQGPQTMNPTMKPAAAATIQLRGSHVSAVANYSSGRQHN